MQAAEDSGDFVYAAPVEDGDEEEEDEEFEEVGSEIIEQVNMFLLLLARNLKPVALYAYDRCDKAIRKNLVVFLS